MQYGCSRRPLGWREVGVVCSMTIRMERDGCSMAAAEDHQDGERWVQYGCSRRPLGLREVSVVCSMKIKIERGECSMQYDYQDGERWV